MFKCTQDFQEIQNISKKLAQRKNKATIRGRKYKKEKKNNVKDNYICVLTRAFSKTDEAG